jgi:ABC-type multidrug transport system fused ATPase/permease subunit
LLTEADSATQRVHYYQGQSGCWAGLFYGWVQPLISFGNSNEIVQDNLEELRPEEKAQAVYENWIEIWRQLRNTEKVTPLWKSVWKSFKGAFYWAFFLDFLESTFIMTTPLMIRFIIAYLQGEQGDSRIWKGAVYLLLMVAVRFFRAFFYAHASFAFMKLGMAMSNSLTLGIVEKSMRFSSLCNKRFKMGELVNILQVDAMRLTGYPRHLSAMIMLPYQLVYGIILMIWTIQYSFLGGFGVIVLATLVNSVISKFTGRYQKAGMTATDNRMKGTNEVYNAIKFIKVNAWEEYFYDRLDERRETELFNFRRRFISESFSTFSMWLTPKLILAVTFTIYTLTDHTLDPVTAFTTQAIFAFLQFTLQNLPSSISQVIEGRLGLTRIEQFLMAEEIDRSFITHQTYDTSNDRHAILLENGNFFWDKKDERAAENDEEVALIRADPLELDLKDIRLDIKKGDFVAFIGDVGSGKSSLLYSLLGEMKFPKNRPRPQLKINGKISLVTQKPWIVNATVRENITFGMEFDLRKYEEVIHYASLSRDLELFTHGDQTMIGEKGATLSGGQKARISFARSLYSESDILLLDDLLSAVDVHVGKFLVKEALMKYVVKKTRVLVTHALYYLKYVDKIYILEAGEIVDAGDYDKIRSTKRFQAIYANLTKGHEEEAPAGEAESESEDEEGQEEETPDRSRVSMAQTDYAHDISPDKKTI